MWNHSQNRGPSKPWGEVKFFLQETLIPQGPEPTLFLGEKGWNMG